MQYLLALFMVGASVVAGAALTSPQSSYVTPPMPGPPRMPAPQPSSQSIPPPPSSPSAWFRSFLGGGRPTSPPVPPTVTPLPQQEEEEKKVLSPYDDLFVPLSDSELQAYKDVAREKCINILIASSKRGFYYNGEPVDVGAMTPDILENEARIAGDRLAYVVRRGEDGRNYLVVDDEVVGPTSLAQSPSHPRIWLQLNEKHYGYILQTEYIRKEYRSVLHLIYDGKDMGEVVAPFGFRLNGDYVIYNKKEADTALYHLYINGKKKAEGSFADFDGKNFGYLPAGKTEGDSKLTLNGKKLGYGGALTFKDSHRAYVLGRTPNVIDPKVYYDGKVIGPGNEPVIEKNHLAYLRSPAEMNKKSTDIRSKVIYDGKEYGYIAGYGFDISLAGDHMAYVRLPDESRDLLDLPKIPDITAYINIDGQDFPGEFGWNNTYVQIAEKMDKNTCG